MVVLLWLVFGVWGLGFEIWLKACSRQLWHRQTHRRKLRYMATILERLSTQVRTQDHTGKRIAFGVLLLVAAMVVTCFVIVRTIVQIAWKARGRHHNEVDVSVREDDEVILDRRGRLPGERDYDQY
jgi:hypothetical protein